MRPRAGDAVAPAQSRQVGDVQRSVQRWLAVAARAAVAWPWSAVVVRSLLAAIICASKLPAGIITRSAATRACPPPTASATRTP